MPDLASPGGDLEPIERASAGELRALQLERLRWYGEPYEDDRQPPG